MAIFRSIKREAFLFTVSSSSFRREISRSNEGEKERDEVRPDFDSLFRPFLRSERTKRRRKLLFLSRSLCFGRSNIVKEDGKRLLALSSASASAATAEQRKALRGFFSFWFKSINNVSIPRCVSASNQSFRVEQQLFPPSKRSSIFSRLRYSPLSAFAIASETSRRQQQAYISFRLLSLSLSKGSLFFMFSGKRLEKEGRRLNRRRRMKRVMLIYLLTRNFFNHIDRYR